VYLKFDHIGPGTPRWKGDPSARIWLRLTNNCRVAITVNTYPVPDGSPKDEQGVMDMVVANEFSGIGYGIFSDGRVAPKPLTKPRPDEMPHDYWIEVGSFQSIPPDKALLFSVPTNHVGERWHFEIPFRFDFPKGNGKGNGFRDPSVGGQPYMRISYSIGDIRPEHRSEIGP
jgi:hypothetical protein